MKSFSTFLFLILLASALSAQSKGDWIIRAGIVGTGTYDDGIWTFAPTVSLGQQTFLFQNSWGFSLDAEYQWHPRWMTGIHTAASYTGFSLLITDGNREAIELKDYTSFSPIMLEQKFVFRPEKPLRPYLGITGGVLLTRNIEFQILPNYPLTAFIFKNPFIYGFLIGADWEVGTQGFIFHSVIRALTFEYTLEETHWTPHQTLLDQVFWMNYNHIQLGIGKIF